LKDAQGRSIDAETSDANQSPYIVNLWVEALDTDVETGKVKLNENGVEYRANRGRNTVTYKFRVLSENDLMAEIAVREGSLYDKLDEEITTLAGGKETLDQILREWSGSPDGDQLEQMLARAERVGRMLDTSEPSVRDFEATYERILKECTVNQVSTGKKSRVVGIVASLDVAVTGKEFDRREKKTKDAEGTYPRAKAGVSDLRNALGAGGNFADRAAEARANAEEAQLRLGALIIRLKTIQADITKSLGLPDYIKKLEKMEKEAAHQQEVLEEIAKQLEGDIFGK